MPIKPFHFDPDFDEAHLVLFGAYMQLSALCVILKGIVEESGLDASWAGKLVDDLDRQVARTIRESDIGPSKN